MSAMPDCSCFCLICYKPIQKYKETVNTTVIIGNFIRNVNQFVKSQVRNAFSDAINIEKVVKCCTKCEDMLTGFTTSYHELKLLEFKLESLLDKLVEKVNYANRVPARWIHVNRVLEETFPNDLDNKAECQNRIRKFRQNLSVAAHQRKLLSKPRVLLPRVKTTAILIKPTVSNAADKLGKVCPKCGKTFRSMKDLEIHLEHHKDQSEWKWKCKICPKRFATKSNLEVHCRKHTGVKPFKCRFCGEDFRYRSIFTKHLKNSHKNEKGVEKELKRKWVLNSDPISIASAISVADQDEYQPECDDDDNMAEDWIDYSGDHNDILVDPDDDKFSEDLTELLNHYEETAITRDIVIGESTAVFRDPQIQIKLEHSLASMQTEEIDSFPLLPEVNTASLISEEDPITLDQHQPIQNVTHAAEVNQCVKCGKILKTAYGLKIHLEYHKDPKDWKYGCKTCGKNCATRQNLETHMKIHKNINSFKCHYCGETFRNGLALKSHLLDMHGNDKGTRQDEIVRKPKKHVENRIADVSLNAKNVIVKEGEQFAKDGPKQNRYSLRENRVTSFVFDEIYSDEDDNSKETGLENSKRPKLNLKISQQFKQKKSGPLSIKLNISGLDRTKLSILECEVCTRKFPSFLIKENHFKICHDFKRKTGKVKLHKCDKDNCTAYFLSKYQLLDHYRREHSNKVNQVKRGRKWVPNNNLKMNKIPTTKLKINESKNYSLRNKKLSSFKESEEKIDKDNSSRKKIGKSDGQWRSALKFECNICKGMYTSVSKREDHFKKAHDLSGIKEGSKVEKCGVDNCTAYFLNERQLHLHRWWQHYKKDPEKNKKGQKKETFECEKCGKCFTIKNSLHVHKLYHHGSSEWKWKCEICGKKSPTKFKMGEHVRTHTGETPYQCRFCGDRFEVVNKLSRHLKLWHKKQMDGKGDGKRESYVKKKNQSDKKLNEVVNEFTDGVKNSELEGKFHEEKLEIEIFEGDDKTVVGGMCLDGIDLNSPIQEENDKIEEIEGQSVMEMDEKNLLTRKGDCFGDGTLVEFEDLD